MLQTLSGEEGDRPKGSLSYNAEHFVCLFVVLNCSRIPLQANIFKALFTPDNFDINDVLYLPFPSSPVLDHTREYTYLIYNL